MKNHRQESLEQLVGDLILLLGKTNHQISQLSTRVTTLEQFIMKHSSIQSSDSDLSPNKEKKMMAL